MSRIFLDQSFPLTYQDSLVALAAIGFLKVGGEIWFCFTFFFFLKNFRGGEREK